MAARDNGVNPAQLFDTLRKVAEPILSGLGLSIAQIETQSLADLELSLATLRSAIQRPEAFGTVRLKMTASVGLIVTDAKSESHFEMSILPILLERERLVLARMRALEEVHRLRDLGDVLNLIKDDSVRTRMTEEFNAIREKAALYEKDVEQKRPAVFLGSSTEGLQVAEIIQLNLQHSCDCTIWSQGVFGLSEGTLESLVRVAPSFDYAMLVLTPDDLVTKRAEQNRQPRDNVLFELGLFIGRLGRENTFIIHERGISLELPSDLAGVQAATFARRKGGDNLRATLGPVCTQLKLAMGLR
jgi:predicted nucleotide-binding protein